MKIVLVTGGFDPLHSGHIDYFKSARSMGDKLIVGLNSDDWLRRKKGKEFMPITERVRIIENLSMVDGIVLFDDSDNSSREAIKNVKQLYPKETIIFANGGDRNSKNIPEMDVPGIVFAFGIGGENKSNSSSWILQEWKAPKTERTWGYYRVLHEVEGMKVKELTVEPGQKLSMQRHFKRNEFWIVSSGQCVVLGSLSSGYALPPQTLKKHDRLDIFVKEWHQLTNPFEEPCKIVEIQYGEKCIEDDIERNL